MIKTYDVIVVGGGPAGLFAAFNSASRGLDTLLIEKNDRCGKKLDITGKGRCNVTNYCDRDTFLANVPTNPRFLFAAFSAFPPESVIDFFESRGVKTKVERGNRVFPESDRAHDITSALVSACKDAGVAFKNANVSSVVAEDGKIKGVRCGKAEIYAKNVILSCGGASYPRTGSDGSGHKLAISLGHTVTPIRPSLVPLTSTDKLCRDCMGLSLKNVGIKFTDKNGKTLYEEQGEMMFTHFGLTGPVILSASAYIRGNYPCVCHIDLKPALDEKTLDKRLLRDFSENANKALKNGFSALLPSKLIMPSIRTAGVDPELKLNSLTKEQRAKILSLLKDLTVKITGTRPIDEAIVTGGGVSVKEIDPKTMESKIVKGLYFAGEIIDVDAYTGGFNLQIAFSTGYIAGN
ncbi:MAG: NAD(P)/FAD-dependent oxidoreductase, partial [Clostridiales bacterium]|nr:NAD(P)/FAD-dependent oxidoreductase [Candidatus Coliplasma equi]